METVLCKCLLPRPALIPFIPSCKSSLDINAIIHCSTIVQANPKKLSHKPKKLIENALCLMIPSLFGFCFSCNEKADLPFALRRPYPHRRYARERESKAWPVQSVPVRYSETPIHFLHASFRTSPRKKSLQFKPYSATANEEIVPQTLGVRTWRVRTAETHWDGKAVAARSDWP